MILLKTFLALLLLPLVLLLALLSAVLQEGRSWMAVAGDLPAMASRTFRLPAEAAPSPPSAPARFQGRLEGNWPGPWKAEASLEFPAGLANQGERLLRRVWTSSRILAEEAGRRRDFDKIFNGMPKPEDVAILHSDFWDNRHLLIFYELRFEIALRVPQGHAFRAGYLPLLQQELAMRRIGPGEEFHVWRDNAWFAPKPPECYGIWISGDGNAMLLLDPGTDEVFLKDSQL